MPPHLLSLCSCVRSFCSLTPNCYRGKWFFYRQCNCLNLDYLLQLVMHTSFILTFLLADGTRTPLWQSSKGCKCLSKHANKSSVTSIGPVDCRKLLSVTLDDAAAAEAVLEHDAQQATGAALTVKNESCPVIVLTVWWSRKQSGTRC